MHIIDKVDLRSYDSLDTVYTMFIELLSMLRTIFFVHNMIRRVVHLSAMHEFIHNA